MTSRDAALSGPVAPRSCVLCDADLPRAQSIPSVVRCPQCGLFHTEPPPRRDVTSPEIFEATYGGTRLSRRAQWHVEAQIRMDWVLSAGPTSGRLLEVGCATGEFVCEAARRGFSAMGHDASSWAIEQARDLCGAEFTDGELPTVEGGFDVIAMFHVIEHLHTPVEVMTAVRDRLRPGGYLFAELPNAGARHAVHDLETWPNFEPQEHVAHYDEPTLSRLLSGARFSGISTSTMLADVYDPPARRVRRWAGWWKRGWIAGSRDLLRVVARRS